MIRLLSRVSKGIPARFSSISSSIAAANSSTIHILIVSPLFVMKNIQPLSVIKLIHSQESKHHDTSFMTSILAHATGFIQAIVVFHSVATVVSQSEVMIRISISCCCIAPVTHINGLTDQKGSCKSGIRGISIYFHCITLIPANISLNQAASY